MEPGEAKPIREFYTPLSIYSIVPVEPGDTGDQAARAMTRVAGLMLRNLEAAKIKPRTTAYAAFETEGEPIVIPVAINGYPISLAVEFIADAETPSLLIRATTSVADEDSTNR
jgi:hypothetical protein